MRPDIANEGDVRMTLQRKTTQPTEHERLLGKMAGAFGLSRLEFAELVQSMLAVIRKVGVGAHVEPMDIVHDAFLLAFIKKRSEWPPIEDKKRLCGWLCALTRFAAFNSCKTKRKRIFLAIALQDELEAVPEQFSIESVMEQMQMREVVLEAYEKLPPSQREIIKKHVLEGTSITDLAAEKNCHRATLHRHFAQAMADLRAAVARMIQSLVVLYLLLRAKVAMASTWLQGTLLRLLMRTLIGVGTCATVLTGSTAIAPQVLANGGAPPAAVFSSNATLYERRPAAAEPPPISPAARPQPSARTASTRPQSTSHVTYATASPLAWIMPSEINRKPTHNAAVPGSSPTK